MTTITVDRAVLEQAKPVKGPISDVTEAVTRTVIEVEKLLCKKLGKQWQASGMSIQTLVDELAKPVQAEPVAWRYQNANTDHVYLVWERGTGGRNWTPLFESPCQTCISLARSVMMDQRGEA